METICSNPELYSKWDDQHRFALVRKFPYYIAYRAFPDRIEVVAIHHTSRDPAGWQDR
jgi:toxin ParE1/3/4